MLSHACPKLQRPCVNYLTFLYVGLLTNYFVAHSSTPRREQLSHNGKQLLPSSGSSETWVSCGLFFMFLLHSVNLAFMHTTPFQQSSIFFLCFIWHRHNFFLFKRCNVNNLGLFGVNCLLPLFTVFTIWSNNFCSICSCPCTCRHAFFWYHLWQHYSGFLLLKTHLGNAL